MCIVYLITLYAEHPFQFLYFWVQGSSKQVECLVRPVWERVQIVIEFPGVTNNRFLYLLTNN